MASEAQLKYWESMRGKTSCVKGKHWKIKDTSKMHHSPWNKDKKLHYEVWSKSQKGIHLSPKSEFKKGMISWNKGKTGIYSKETIDKIKAGRAKQVFTQEQELKRIEGIKEAYRSGKRKPIRGEKSHFWRGGLREELYSIDWTKTLKRSIRERDNHICRICNTIQKDKAHDVHHIDYDKKNCNPINLITLCKKCHAKTNQKRDYWIEYFKNNIKK